MSYPEDKKDIEHKDFAVSNITSTEFELGSEKTSFIDVDRTNGCSSWMAYFNIVCVVAGTGILGLPMALKQGGWMGMLVLILSWLMSTYTSVILIRCLYANDEGRLYTYKDIATAAFGPIGGWVTFFFNAWILLGAPILYMVLTGANLRQLCAGTVAELDDIKWTIIASVVVAIPFIFLKTMKEVAWVSAFGVVAIFIVVFVVMIQSAVDRPNHLNSTHDAVIWEMFPVALATISFSFGGNVVYPHVEAAMKKPQDWPKVAAGGLSTCAAMYIIVAVCGYLVYGTDVASPVYNSIPEGAGQIVAIVVITINVMTSAPILTTSFSLDLEEMFNVTVERFGKVKEFLIRAAIRIAIMVVVTVIACTVPFFGALMSLIGAFANCTLIFIFPVVFYFKLTGIRNKPWYEIIWCGFIILLGTVGLVFGTIEAVKELITAFDELYN
ncbi:unnamed protein product [Mucor hiemalis]